MPTFVCSANPSHEQDPQKLEYVEVRTVFTSFDARYDATHDVVLYDAATGDPYKFRSVEAFFACGVCGARLKDDGVECVDQDTLEDYLRDRDAAPAADLGEVIGLLEARGYAVSCEGDSAGSHIRVDRPEGEHFLFGIHDEDDAWTGDRNAGDGGLLDTFSQVAPRAATAAETSAAIAALVETPAPS